MTVEVKRDLSSASASASSLFSSFFFLTEARFLYHKEIDPNFSATFATFSFVVSCKLSIKLLVEPTALYFFAESISSSTILCRFSKKKNVSMNFPKDKVKIISSVEEI